MEKTVDFSRSVHDICTAYPEVKDLLVSFGFKNLANAASFQTAARFVTIPQAAGMHGADMLQIRQKIREMGFDIQE
ncbi:MAG: DUF1858 domain-containing protein [Oscillospiraceae bacterium]|nr:DUF1858 domain-containing protein [Oscillospiraceae bacterium]